MRKKILISTLSKAAYALMSDENVIILRGLGFGEQFISQLKGDLANVVETLEESKRKKGSTDETS